MNLRILETEGRQWVIVGYNNNQIGESYRTKADAEAGLRMILDKSGWAQTQ